MPAIDFPSDPTLGQEYTNGINTYEWDGTAWRLVRTSAQGPTGPTGPTGADSTVEGPTGPTGPAGPTGADSTVEGPTGPTGPTGSFSVVAWSTFTPNLYASTTNPTLGDGTSQGRYASIGSTIVAEIKIVGGSVGFSRGSGTYSISLPTNAIASNFQPVGSVVMYDSGPNITYFGKAIFADDETDRVQLFMHSQVSTFDQGVAVTDSTPFLFGANDQILVQITYEADLG